MPAPLRPVHDFGPSVWRSGEWSAIRKLQEVIRKPLIPDEISAPEYLIVIIFIVLGAELLVA
jgi:hypothetical protein